MSELREILAAHAARYPRMTPQDAGKLLYQSAFGCGHLIRDRGAALDALRREWETAPPAPALAEELGNGWVRVYLGAVGEDALSLLGNDFLRSAAEPALPGFPASLSLLREMTEEGLLPFSLPALDDWLRDYAAAGYPMLSHSPVYREAYTPAYRVVKRRKSLLLLIHEALRRAPALLAIDGRCASGKTSLAGLLARRYGWSVVHMDDFFLRPSQRTPERYREPGGNIDHERFLAEVLTPLRQGLPARYRPFDCHTMSLGPERVLPPGPVTVIEGSYSCHPALRSLYDLRVFLTVPEEEQLRRIAARNGPEGLAAFRARWIPLEERYFSACAVREQCAYELETPFDTEAKN